MYGYTATPNDPPIFIMSSNSSALILLPMLSIYYLNSGIAMNPSLSLSKCLNYSIRSSTLSSSFSLSSITSKRLENFMKPSPSGSIYFSTIFNSCGLRSKSRARIIVLSSPIGILSWSCISNTLHMFFMSSLILSLKATISW